MGRWISNFDTTAEFETFSATTGYSEPHVTLTKDTGKVMFKEFVETRVVAKFNVIDTSSPTQLCHSSAVSKFSEIEIDGVVQTAVTSTYTFDTLGEHTVKYTLTDPTSIGQRAFSLCTSLTSVNIPNSITSIGRDAFMCCSSLTSIDIPSGVTSIGSTTFQGCSSLTSINILDSITSIGDMAFNDCSGLTSCTIGSGVTSIGGQAFNKCTSLISIVCNATTAPTISSSTFQNVKTSGTLTVPSDSSGYDTWMQNANYYLGLYGWTKVEQ